MKKSYDEPKSYKLYIIYHPLKKEFFIHFSTAKSLRDTLSKHYSLKNFYTKKLFEETRYTIYPPEMYLIFDGECSTSDIYSKQIIYLKYFIEQGLKCLNNQDEIYAASDLYEENLQKYNEIKDINLQEIICKGNRQFPHYGREIITNIEEKTVRKQVKVYVNDEEDAVITSNAKKNNMSVSGYIKEVALAGNVISFNYDAITEHNKQISNLTNDINKYIRALLDTGMAYPEDVQTVINLISDIRKSELELLKKHNNEQEKIMKTIKKEVLKKAVK